MSLHALWQCDGLIYVNLFSWRIPHSRCLHRTRPILLGTLGRAQKHDVLLRCVWFPCLSTTIRRTSSRLFRSVMFACAPMPFPFSICICWSAHCPRTGWVCQWMPFWIPADDSFKKAFVEEWVFQITDTSDISLSGGQVDVIPETPRVACIIVTMVSTETRGFSLFSGTY